MGVTDTVSLRRGIVQRSAALASSPITIGFVGLLKYVTRFSALRAELQAATGKSASILPRALIFASR
jgi:hypothetical protein